MSTFPIFLSTTILGFFLFLFFYWKRMREDYTPEVVFSSGFYILVGLSFGVLVAVFLSSKLPLSSVFDPRGLWFWGAFLGYMVALVIGALKLNLRFVEAFEASSVGLLVWLAVHYLVSSFLFFLLTCLLVALFFFLDKRYRRFSWYKSGRVGFSGFVTLAFYFLARTLVAIASLPMVSLIGRLDFVPSGISAFLLLWGIYQLSESY